LFSTIITPPPCPAGLLVMEGFERVLGMRENSARNISIEGNFVNFYNKW
jgi:hypothetical protein